jgi:hypothetical protein
MVPAFSSTGNLLDHVLNRLLAARDPDGPVVCTRAQFALHEHQRAFQQPWRHLGKALPEATYDVPLCLIFPLAVVVFPGVAAIDKSKLFGNSLTFLIAGLNYSAIDKEKCARIYVGRFAFGDCRIGCGFSVDHERQPIDGPGGKIFPATYSGGVYAVEKKRILDFEGKWAAESQSKFTSPNIHCFGRVVNLPGFTRRQPTCVQDPGVFLIGPNYCNECGEFSSMMVRPLENMGTPACLREGLIVESYSSNSDEI